MLHVLQHRKKLTVKLLVAFGLAGLFESNAAEKEGKISLIPIENKKNSPHFNAD